ncbi:ABC transporter permease [Nocardioides yefusunii]|uniref:ABC transporter permease n=1 Tax=Nocardioides yefusunii TaxID=2500546 RepID=A0ABW1QUK4_9ACTN|nr:ABC transporter permease [Nocardioides yefusunii]
MDQVLQFAVIGLSAGAVYAVLASSLVAVYSATGLINFAQGAVALWALWQTAALQYDGTLVLPVGSVSLSEGPLSTWPAVLIGVLSGVVWSLAAHFLVFKPLRKAPALAQVVASIGVLLLLISLVSLRFDSISIYQVTSPFTDEAIAVGEVTLSRNNLVLAAVALVVALCLWAYFRFTTPGIATRAAAESEQAARLMGFSPDRLAVVVWAITGAASSFVVILAAAKLGLSPTTYAFHVVPALAVALIGRMTSVVVAAVAGLVLGALQSDVTYLTTKQWWPDWIQPSVVDVLPLLIVVVTLFAFGGKIPARGNTGEVRMPAVPTPSFKPVVFVGLVAIVAVAMVLTSGTWRYAVISSVIMTVLALSVVLLTGYLGQISVATIAFAGIGGFLLSKLGNSWGVPFPANMLLAVLGATVVGVVVGLPALRIRGAQLAVVTMAAAVALQNFVLNNTALTPITGNPVKSPELFGYSFGVTQGSTPITLQFGLFALFFTALMTWAVIAILRGATGRAFLAVRSNERAAASAGIDVAGTKVLGFALSSFLAGVGGCLIAFSHGHVSGSSYSIVAGLTLLAMVYLGGITSVSGAVIAGVAAPLGLLYTLLNNTFEAGQYYSLIASLLLIVTAVLNPTGIAGTVHSLRQHLKQSHDEPTPTPVETKEPVHA